MALRATRAKAPVAAETLARSKSAHAPATVPVPIDLAPIVSRHKKQGRVSIRIERMPQSARLSHGRNNGSGSWSLAQDELEDLAYLPPENASAEHVLAIRIIGSEGATLALHELTVSAAGQSLTEPASLKSTRAPADSEQTSLLRNELEALKAKLAARESELAETASRVARNLAEKQREWHDAQPDSAAKLAEAETDWKAAEAIRLAAAEAEWEKKFAAAHAEAEKERRRAQSDLSTRNAAEAAAKMQHERDRTQWQHEYDAALTQAKEQWENENAACLAAAKGEWQRKSAAAHAELAAKCADLEADLERAEALAKPEENAGQRLHDELAAAKKALAASETALMSARAAAVAERSQQEQEARARLDRAEEKWRAAESARLAAAQAQWERDAAEKFAEMTARCNEAEDALARLRHAAPVQPPHDSEEIDRLREDYTSLQVTLATREIEIERLRLVTQAGAPFAPEQKITLHSDGGWHPSDPELPARRLPLRFIAQLVVVIIIAALATWAFPYVVSLLPYDWQYSVDETMAEFGLYTGASTAAVATTPPQPYRTVPAPFAAPSASLARPTRLRAAPSKSAASLASLRHGAHVTVLATQNGWTRLRLDDKREGWVFSTSLSEEPSAAKNK